MLGVLTSWGNTRREPAASLYTAIVGRPPKDSVREASEIGAFGFLADRAGTAERGEPSLLALHDDLLARIIGKLPPSEGIRFANLFVSRMGPRKASLLRALPNAHMRALLSLRLSGERLPEVSRRYALLFAAAHAGGSDPRLKSALAIRDIEGSDEARASAAFAMLAELRSDDLTAAELCRTVEIAPRREQERFLTSARKQMREPAALATVASRVASFRDETITDEVAGLAQRAEGAACVTRAIASALRSRETVPERCLDPLLDSADDETMYRTVEIASRVSRRAFGTAFERFVDRTGDDRVLEALARHLSALPLDDRHFGFDRLLARSDTRGVRIALASSVHSLVPCERSARAELLFGRAERLDELLELVPGLMASTVSTFRRSLFHATRKFRDADDHRAIVEAIFRQRFTGLDRADAYRRATVMLFCDLPTVRDTAPLLSIDPGIVADEHRARVFETLCREAASDDVRFNLVRWLSELEAGDHPRAIRSLREASSSSEVFDQLIRARACVPRAEFYARTRISTAEYCDIVRSALRKNVSRAVLETMRKQLVERSNLTTTTAAEASLCNEHRIDVEARLGSSAATGGRISVI